MTSVDILPDVIPVVRAWLISQAEVTALVGTRVSTQSGETPIFPYVLLERIGGGRPVSSRLGRVLLQVSCWGVTPQSASLVARTVEGWLLRMSNYRHASGVVTGVDLVSGSQDLPDTARTPPTPRSLFTVDIYFHA